MITYGCDYLIEQADTYFIHTSTAIEHSTNVVTAQGLGQIRADFLGGL
jgi:hypothetical protein